MQVDRQPGRPFDWERKFEWNKRGIRIPSEPLCPIPPDAYLRWVWATSGSEAEPMNSLELATLLRQPTAALRRELVEQAKVIRRRQWLWRTRKCP